MNARNLDHPTVEGFGYEWTVFDQRNLSRKDSEAIFASYFKMFPWKDLPAGAVGFDLGCGTGRWAAMVAPRVGRLHCIDASREALRVAEANLKNMTNCEFHHGSVDAIPLEDGSMDFGYSLGVLHHVPDTLSGLKACTAKLRRGAPFLLYLYYALDNRPKWYRIFWKASDRLRGLISALPYPLKYLFSQAIALSVYWPLARAVKLAEIFGQNISNLPLMFYRHRSLYVMRTDAFDRFCTPLEQRFTRMQIEEMMRAAGLERIEFSDAMPYWCSVGYKK